MHRPMVTLSLATLILGGGLALGCSDSSTGPSPSQRIAKQVSHRLSGEVLTTWRYSYDPSGTVTEVRAYDASDVLTSTAAYTHAGGLRTQTTTRDTNGVVLSSRSYTYTSGVLSRSDSYDGTGTLAGYSTYTFVDGKKMTTLQFTPSGTLLIRTDFTYDPATGRRTGATVRDAQDSLMATTTRTYAQGLWTQSQIDYSTGGESVIRSFTYERGPAPIDEDIYYEF
jgi:hypothetical protein